MHYVLENIVTVTALLSCGVILASYHWTLE